MFGIYLSLHRLERVEEKRHKGLRLICSLELEGCELANKTKPGRHFPAQQILTGGQKLGQTFLLV